MKRISSLILAGLLALGCSRESPPGGPGATGDGGAAATDRPRANDRVAPGVDHGNTASEQNTFTLKVPLTRVDVERGEREEVEIGIDRGGDFRQSVLLQFEPPPGIQVIPRESELLADQDSVKVLIEAAPDAVVGEASIVVTGTPQRGAPADVRLLIEIEADD